MADIDVQRQDNRYEIQVDGEIAGLVAYVDRGEQRIFTHTEIDRSHRGEGLSTVLIERALADTEVSGRRIVPVCPAVLAFLGKHDGFASVTDPVTDETLDWLDATFGRR